MSGEPNASAPGHRQGWSRFRSATSWLIAALAVSLALNAFVIGAVVGERWHDGRHHGHWSRHHGDVFRSHHVPGSSIRQLSAMLDAGAREKLRKAARPHRARMKLLLAEAAGARLDALDALRAREFDAEALTGAFARAGEAERAAAELTHAIIAEAAGQFTPDEREAVNKALEEPVEHWRDRVERRRKRLERWQDRLEREQQGKNPD